MRVKFAEGEQRSFIKKAIGKNSLSAFCKANAEKINTKYSTFKDYFQETQTLPRGLFLFLTDYGKVQISDFNFKIIKKNWWQSDAGKKGATSLLRKYSRAELLERRAKGGKNSAKKWANENEITAEINEEIAELAGAYLGDGTITTHFVRFFGDVRYDIKYCEYLQQLIERNFNLSGKIRIPAGRNLCYLEVSSKSLCNYFNNKLGIKFGDKIKNKTTIPKEIAENEKLLLACIRGLVDTDGSVSKDNTTISIRFDSHNKAIINQLEELNQKIKLFTFRNAYQIGTKNTSAIEGYFKRVGSSNLRHIIRFREYLRGNLLKKHETLKYYAKYNNLNMPYCIPRNSFNNLQANHINA